jgi:NAD(P)-dependent dehydrogenase (short-subunit alcohol dehydrogenase family)
VIPKRYDRARREVLDCQGRGPRLVCADSGSTGLRQKRYPMTIRNSRVVILGGTSGIGLATAKAASEAGASLVVASSRQASVDAALAELPPGTVGAVVDLTAPETLAAFFDSIGPFDHLVYTAGENLSLMKVADYDIDAARKFFELRFFCSIEAVHLAVPHINPGGSIVLTSGSAAIRPGAGWMLGAAVSSAVIAVTKALALELAPIRVNAIAPGVVRSPLWSSMSQDEQESMYEGLAGVIPLGRVAEVEDVAKSYVHVLDQNYATGTTTVIDGGSVLV